MVTPRTPPQWHFGEIRAGWPNSIKGSASTTTRSLNGSTRGHTRGGRAAKHMGKPVTILESLSAHALSFDARTLVVEHKDNEEWVYIQKRDGIPIPVSHWESSSSNATELLENLRATAQKPLRTVLHGEVNIVNVKIHDSPGQGAFEVTIERAPKLDPSVAPKFTAKQGRYLAFIHHYIKLHREAPAESDIQRYFQVSAPSGNAMMQTLQRNSLIERAPKVARSIRLLVKPEHLPPLD